MAASDKISPNAYAMYQLGGMYQNGIGTEQDLKESERWYQRAYQGFLSLEEKSRDDKLWYRLGQMNMAGIGTAVNLEAAKLYFNRSAGYGNTDAEYGLGCLYANPDFSEYNIPKSIEHFFKAAEAQNQFAQYQLGRLYLGENEDIPRDIEKALSFLQLSADQGNQFALYQLGRLYFHGDEGIPKDMDKALFYLQASAELGNEYAQSFLDYIERGYQPISNLLYCGASIFSSPIRRHLEKQLYAADHTLIREEQKKKAALGHNRNDHKHTMTY